LGSGSHFHGVIGVRFTFPSEAIEWALKNPSEVKAIEAKLLGAPSPVVPGYIAEMRPADLEIYTRIGKELKMFRQEHDVNKLVWR